MWRSTTRSQRNSPNVKRYKSVEEIARRRPIDVTAARVTQAGPKNMEPSKRQSSDHGTRPAPWPMIPVPSWLVDVTGVRCGSLTCLGLSDVVAGHHSFSRQQRARWVCRCVCGYYVLRSRKSLLNPKNDLDACDRCLHRQYLQRQERRKADGEISGGRWNLHRAADAVDPSISGTGKPSTRVKSSSLSTFKNLASEGEAKP